MTESLCSTMNVCSPKPWDRKHGVTSYFRFTVDKIFILDFFISLMCVWLEKNYCIVNVYTQRNQIHCFRRDSITEIICMLQILLHVYCKHYCMSPAIIAACLQQILIRSKLRSTVKAANRKFISFMSFENITFIYRAFQVWAWALLDKRSTSKEYILGLTDSIL